MKILKLALALSLLAASSAYAADLSPTLAPGKPAGVHNAQMLDNVSPLLYFGVIAAGLGVAYALTRDDNSASPAKATTAVTSTGTSA
jgi:hypothetical protein